MGDRVMLAEADGLIFNENNEIFSLRGISLAEFQVFETQNQERFPKLEYVSGKVYVLVGFTPDVFGMAEASPQHSELCVRISSLLSNHLPKRGPCRAYDASKGIVRDPERAATAGKNAKGISVLPDVSVQCKDADGQLKPLIVIEVLSPSTEHKDRTDKLSAYKKLSTINEILLVNQYAPIIEVYARAGDVFTWKIFKTGESFVLESIGLQVTVSDVYDGILPIE